jgi:eukaryotic-like serine/threonine-protein kinase
MPDPVSKKSVASQRGDEQRYALRVGSTLRGKWRLDALIGLGGMAAVYAATHRNGQRAAIKVLHEEFARDSKVSERFLMEGYVANRVGHPGCVSVLDDDVSENGEPFLVMELLEGETLRDFWKRTGRRVPPVDVLRIAAQILDCLEACHAQGVIHRDLKPANIFLTKSGQVKILDFGVAQLRYATTNESSGGPTAVGTPAYMSPEQAMGLTDQLDGRTDLFSVGAIIHALCTGRRINHAKSEQEALMMAATTPVPSVARIAPDLPLEIICIIDKALAWDRRNRYGAAGEMRVAVLEALDRIAAGGTRIVPTAPPKSEVKSEAKSTPAEPDSRSHPVREFLGHIDAAITSQRVSGASHTSTERALKAAHQALREALTKEGGEIKLEVRPSNFGFGRTPIWEPEPPNDAIPYHLYASGVRTLILRDNLPLEELRDLFSILVLDPARDLATDDDLVTVLWEKSLPHVGYEAADAFTGGDATEREAFYEEADEIERLALTAGKAFAARVERTEDANVPHPMSLDEVVRSMVETQLELPRDRWRERYVEALVEGYADAARNRDAHILLGGLRRSAATLIGRGQLIAVTALHGEILDHISARMAGNDVARLSSPLTSALFGGDSLELVLNHLRREPNDADHFAPVLPMLPPGELTAVLGALRAGAPEALREHLYSFVELVLAGHEQLVVDVALTADTEVALRLAGIVGKAGTPAARAALESLTVVDDTTLQTEIRVLLAPSQEQAFADLGRMLENASSAIRMAALKALVRHSLRGAYPAIARQVRAATFHDVAPDERTELLRTAIILAPEHGEPMVLELVKKGGVFTSQSREASRTIAAQVLGELATDPATVENLRELAQARWGVSEETRGAASAAASQIHARMKRETQGRGNVS